MSMKRVGFLLSLLLFVGACPALAVGSLANVTIHDRSSGEILPVFEADGHWYVAGRVGDEYEVRIRNDSGGDVLAVVSVDGVNVVSGETAATGQSGYVLGAHQSLSIVGWRKSLARVAAFYFSDRSSAYATRTGRPDDLGVIGVAVFRRKAQPPVELEQPQVRKEAPSDGRLRRQEPYDAPASSEAPSSSHNASGGLSVGDAARPASPAPVEQSIGTGHGRSQPSYARYVSFERESDTPNELIVLRYDTRANLVARGVIPSSPHEPNPFPARFVPDPPPR
jgi:hypothetical protein